MGRLQGARTNALRRLIPCFGQTTPEVRIRPVARARATTSPRPQRSWTVIRDAVWKRHHLTKRRRVHVDPADDIPAAFKATGLAPRVPPLGLVTVAVYRTPPLRVAMPPLRVAMPAGCTMLIPGDAWAMRPTRHDAVLFGLLLQVIDVLGRTPTGSGAGCGGGRSGGTPSPTKRASMLRPLQKSPTWRVPIGALTPTP